MAIENISQDLADLLVTKNFDVKYKGEDGNDSAADQAKTFGFDWIAQSGKNYGTAVIVLGDDNELQLFFGDNLGKSMEDPQDKQEWFKFLEEMSDFSTRHNIGTFSPKNINQLKHTMAGIAAIKEGLFEGYYGTRKVSYMGEETEARLVIKHNKMIGENDKRFRYVESLFIETVDQERFKLPFKNLAGGRAMLEHVRQGGKPYDIRGSHICEIVSEMAVLSRFNRASQQRVFEGATKELVESAQHYYQQLKENLHHISTRRGYGNYFESWSPADIGSEDALVEDIKTLFVEQTIDSRIEAALPTLAKLQKQGNAMKEAQIFENWINNIAEGTWQLPETGEQQAKLKELMSKPLIAGPDGTNATEQLYDIVGDDELFDIIGNIAEEDPNANIWDDGRVENRLSALGIYIIDDNDAPDNGQEPADAQEPISEGRMLDETGETLNHILDRFKFEVRQFEENGILDNDLYRALEDYYKDTGELSYAEVSRGDPYEWVSHKLGQTLNVDESNSGMLMPEGSCNMTHEGNYCPEHGLAECGTVAGGIAPVVMGEEGQTSQAYRDAMAAHDSAGREYRLGRAQDRMAQRAAEPKTLGQKVKQDIFSPLAKLAKGDVKGALGEGDQEAFVNKHKDDAINYNGAVTGSYYESKDDPLARIKALAQVK